MDYRNFDDDQGCGEPNIIGESCKSGDHCYKCFYWLKEHPGKTLNNTKDKAMKSERTWSSASRSPRIGDVVRFDVWRDSVRITAIDGYPDTHCRTDGDCGQIVMRVNWDAGRYEIIESGPVEVPGEQTTAGAAHYVKGDLQVIDVIEKWDLNRNLAQVVAYVLRCDHKGQRESDLEKAIDYLWRERYGTWATLPERTKK